MKSAINLRSLEALRGILAVFVLGHHARWLLWIGYENWIRAPHAGWQKLLVFTTVPLRFGHEAVMAFFVLSGFFIHLRAAEAMAEGSEAKMDVTVFFRRRAHRLLPPYLLALVTTVLLDTCGRLVYPALYQAATGDAFVDENFARMGYSMRSVVPAMFLLPDSLGRQFGSNGPLWSLAFEVVYYLLYPAWLCLRRRGWLMSYGAGLGIAVLAVPFASFGFLPLVLAHYPVWLMGAVLAEGVQRKLPISSLRWLVLPTAASLALALVILRPSLPVLIAAYTLGGGATVLWFALLPAATSSFLVWRAWEKVGLGSYTIYIVHFPALTLLAAFALRWEGQRPFSGWPALVGVGLTSLFCWLCYQLCERHFLHRKIPAPSVCLSVPLLSDPLTTPEIEL